VADPKEPIQQTVPVLGEDPVATHSGLIWDEQDEPIGAKTEGGAGKRGRG